MNRLWYAVVAALLVAPAIAQDQSARRLGDKQKAWVPANFRTGLSSCSVGGGKDSFTLSGEAQVSFENGDGGGLDLAVGGGDGAAPSVSAHAINTKGTGASGQTMDKSCASAPDGATASSVAACSVSGNPDAPVVRFAIPLTAFGAAENYVGHVTLIKREAGSAAEPHFRKKGYDYYAAHSDMGAVRAAAGEIEMNVVATCDTSGLKTKPGKPTKGHYDLAVGTKA